MKVLEDEDHFSFVERLMEEDYVLTKVRVGESGKRSY